MNVLATSNKEEALASWRLSTHALLRLQLFCAVLAQHGFARASRHGTILGRGVTSAVIAIGDGIVVKLLPRTTREFVGTRDMKSKPLREMVIHSFAASLGVALPPLCLLRRMSPRHQSSVSQCVSVMRRLPPGRTLGSFLRSKGGKDKATHQHIVKQLFAVLRKLHSHGIIHGDVHDENVWICDKNASLLLLDFGRSVRFSNPRDVRLGVTYEVALMQHQRNVLQWTTPGGMQALLAAVGSDAYTLETMRLCIDTDDHRAASSAKKHVRLPAVTVTRWREFETAMERALSTVPSRTVCNAFHVRRRHGQLHGLLVDRITSTE